MGGRGSSSKINNTQMQTAPPNIVPTQQQAQQLNTSAFSDTDSQDYHDLYNGRQYFQQQNLTIDQQLATMNYLADQPESGSLYSMSQNMNQAMATGQKLTANQQYTHDNLMASMHNLGYNMNLTRYDHDTFVNGLLASQGVQNADYSTYTVAQLQQALVGKSYGENKFLSTSYNDFQNAPMSSKNVFTSRAVKITYKAAANVQGMMPGNGPGGALGEMIIAPSGASKNMKIVGVRSTGQMARMKGTQSYSIPQIEIIVEVSKQH